VADDPVTRARALLAAATPGPWSFCAYGDHDGDGYLCHCGKLWSATDSAEPMLEVSWSARGDKEIANARLIMAAPQLLAELADLVAQLQSDMDGDRSLMERLRVERDEARDRLRAVERYADGLHFAGDLKGERLVRAAISSASPPAEPEQVEKP
jgi:hypothetical protein